MERATISYRLAMDTWLKDDVFDAFWQKHSRLGRGFDELALFINKSHGPEALPVMARRLEAVQKRLAFIRAAGCRAGINNLTTVGHHEENLEETITGFTNVVDMDGRACRGSFCMNDERFLTEHVQPLYRMIAQAGPDFIWVDDDMRMLGHMPIRETCFCDHCLALFTGRTGRAWTRETLRAAFDANTQEALALRKAWLAFNRQTIVRCLTAVEEAVHGVDPTIELGQMTGERPYEGYAFDEWEQALSGPGNTPVMWRPGGGFYWEDTPGGMPEKAHQIGRQIAYLSNRVQRIESEIENHPKYRLYKSKRITGVEAACHIAAGCTGAAYNVLRPDGYLSDHEGRDYEDLAHYLADKRFFHDAMAAAMGRSPAVGVHAGWTKDIYAAAGMDRGWFAPGAGPRVGSHMEWLHRLGLPPAYHPDHALVTALNEDSVLAMDDDQVMAALRGGVYMDGDALLRLTQRGFGPLCGFATEERLDADSQELFLDHPVNSGQAGWVHNAYQSFWKAPAYTLRPLGEGAQVVSRLLTIAGADRGPTTGLYVNRLGGRVCVAGYGPWMLSASRTKADQVKRIFSWLATGPMGYVESYHKAELWVRGYDNPPAALLNMSMDDAEDVVVRLPSSAARRSALSYEGDRMELIGAPCGDGLMRYTIPFVKSFSMVLIV